MIAVENVPGMIRSTSRPSRSMSARRPAELRWLTPGSGSSTLLLPIAPLRAGTPPRSASPASAFSPMRRLYGYGLMLRPTPSRNSRSYGSNSPAAGEQCLAPVLVEDVRRRPDVGVGVDDPVAVAHETLPTAIDN